MFSRYYQSELTYLRELGREFAAANPALAGLFAERGGDPDVERLLEGFAFLTGRIRERMDDALPEVVEQLCQLTLPQYTRAIPAMTIVEFTPNIHTLKGVVEVPAGAELSTRPIDGTPCSFRTTRPLELLPLQLTAVVLDPSAEASPKIRVAFQTTELGTHIVPGAKSIPLFIHGALGQSSTLFLWFERHLKSVVLTSGTERIELGPDSVRASAVGAGGVALPWPARAPDDLRLVLEYYSLPSLLLMLELTGLERFAGKIGENFEVTFQFDRAPKLPERVEKDAFRLHCVPAINLFATTAEPVRRDVGAHESIVRAAGLPPGHADVFEITKVTASRSKSAPIEYGAYFDFVHMPTAAPFYWSRRAISPIDHGLDTYISFGTPHDRLPSLAEEIVSVECLCTNRNLPNELRVGDVSVATPRSPTVAPFRNITPVTRAIRPAVGAELSWRFVAHTALNRSSLSDPAALRALLALYNFHETVDVQLGRANRLRVEAIRDVKMAPARRLLDHVAVRGTKTAIEVDETSFASIGDVYLFGCALDALFAAQTPVNSFHELAMTAHPSGTPFAWKPRTGLEQIY